MKGKSIFLLLALSVSLPSPAQSDADSLRINHMLERALQLRLNKPDTSIHLVREALKEIKPESTYLNGFAYYILSYGNWVKANYKLSAEYGFRSLRYMETTPYDYERSLILLELCRTFLDLNNNAEGKYYLDQVRAITHKRPDDKRILANYYRELSFYYIEVGKLDSAIFAADHGLEIYINRHDTLNASVLIGRKVKVMLAYGQYKAARQLSRQSSLLDSLIGNRRALGISYYQTASSLAGLKVYDSAMHFLKKAARVNLEIRNWQALRNTHTKMSEVLVAQKKPMEAIDHLKLAEMYKDSLYSTSSSAQIEEMKILYETEKKDNTIALLEKENALKLQQTRSQRWIVGSLALVVVSLWAVLFLVIRSQRLQRKANDELKEKNASIEQQKEEMQLQAEKLQDLNQLKSKLFSVVSHDLRGPINNLQALLDLLSKNMLTQDEFLKHSDKLRASVNVTQRTLENLLNWSMSQMEGIRTRPTIMDIRNSIEEARRLLSDLALRKNIQIDIKLNEALLVYADPDQIQVVLRNLIHNGIKFSKTDSQVVVNAEVKDKMCYVTVKDSGIGMTTEELSRLELVKDHFTKVGTLQEKGTGLGFLLCREFVNRNDGKLYVSSEAGVGTEISFTIPLA